MAINPHKRIHHLTVRVDDDELIALEEDARREETTRSEILRRLVREGREARERPPKK